MASVANLAPNTTPGYLPVFDSKLALTNSPLYRFSSNILGFNSTLPFLWYSGNNIGMGDGFNYTQSGNHNLMIGTSVASHLTSGSQNVLLGGSPGNALTTGNDNVSIGSSSLRDDLVGSKNIAIGTGALQHTLDSGNIGIGYSAGVTSTNGTNNIFIGYNANTSSSSTSNEISIGYAAIGHGNDSVTLGNTGVNDLWLGTNHVFPASGGVVINPTLNFVPYKSGSSSFADSWWYYTANGMGTDTNVFFGPGTTNWITRTNGTDLLSANTGNDSKFIQQNGAGALAILEASGNTAVISSAGTASTLGFKNGSDWLQLYNGNFYPVIDATANSGTLLSAWKTNSSTTLMVRGFANTSANYSILTIHQASTNDPMVFDLQTAGTAGYARSFAFKTNGVEVFRIPGSAIWDDSMVPEALVRVGASAPSQANFNGGPGQTLQFQNNRDDAILASVQLSHRYKQGTDLYPHVHWSETATTTAGTNIVWELQYTWANPDAGVFPAYSTLLMTNHVTTTNWWHSMEAFPAVSGTGRSVSAIMVFQLRRLANSAAADDYDKNVAFLGFDLHYQVDSPGSDNPVVKSF